MIRTDLSEILSHYPDYLDIHQKNIAAMIGSRPKYDRPREWFDGDHNENLPASGWSDGHLNPDFRSMDGFAAGMRSAFVHDSTNA